MSQGVINYNARNINLFGVRTIDLDYMKYKSSIFASNLSTQMLKK
jgi:hypothetical protein